MTSRADFAAAVRRGRRAGRSRLVAHALLGPTPPPGVVDSLAAVEARPARVGFVVSKAVGGSVVRHRVQRRLRHVVRDRLGVLPMGTLLVVRALPPAADATSAELAADVDAAFRKLGLTVRPAAGHAAAGPAAAPSGPVAPVDNSPSPVDGAP